MLDHKQTNKIRYKTKTGWHEQFGFKAVLKVPPTPNSLLAKSVKEVLKSTPAPKGFRILVRESNGSSLSNNICNFYNPRPKRNCSRPKCLVCINSKDQSGINSNSTDCWSSGITYRLNCNLCADQGVTAQYEGESSRSCYTRGVQHLRDLESKKPGTPLGEHATQFHPGTAMDQSSVTMVCTGKHPGPTQRLTSEGMLIEKLIRMQKDQGPDKVVVINSKTNFHQPSLITQQSGKLSLV